MSFDAMESEFQNQLAALKASGNDELPSSSPTKNDTLKLFPSPAKPVSRSLELKAQYNKLENSAQTVQGAMRGKEARGYHQLAKHMMNQNASTVQGLVRGREAKLATAQLQLETRGSAALTVQGAITGRVARQSVQQAYDTGASTVQAAMRGQQGRVTAELEHGRQRSDSATAVQAAVRARGDRQRVEALSAEEERRRGERMIQRASQSPERDYQAGAFSPGRSAMAVKKQYDAIQGSASRVQGGLRGRESRRETDRLHAQSSQASRVQGALRGRESRLYTQAAQGRLSGAAAAIQAGLRGRGGRREARFQDEAQRILESMEAASPSSPSSPTGSKVLDLQLVYREFQASASILQGGLVGREARRRAQGELSHAASAVQASIRGRGSRGEVQFQREEQARYEAVWGSREDPRRAHVLPHVLVEANRTAKEAHRHHVWRVYGALLLKSLARIFRLGLEALAIRGLAEFRTRYCEPQPQPHCSALCHPWIGGIPDTVL